MKERIVPGSVRIEREASDYRVRLEELRASIRKKYAAELAAAGPLERWRIWLRLQRELREESRKLPPSNLSV